MRTIIITGASDGIGAAAARQIAGTDNRLILVGRSPEKTRSVAYATGAEYYLADFTKLDEVRDLANELDSACDQIDVLANNAGGMFSGPTATTDGFEKTIQVNHLAPVLLTHLLLNTLLNSQATIVNTSSIGARLFSKLDLQDLNTWDTFTPNRAYGNAKLANVLFSQGLHDRFRHRGLSSVAFHPGNVATNFASDTDSYFRNVYHGVLNRLLSSPDQGGARLRHFIEGCPGEDWESGRYYRAPHRIGKTHRLAYDSAVVDEHWRHSADMLGISW